MSDSKKQRKQLSGKKKLLFAAVFLVAPLALLEGGLRLAGWPTQRIRTIKKLLSFDPEVFAASIGMHEPSATRTVAWPPELSYEVSINALGLRGPEIERAPPKGVTRILALGDSTTFGFYVKDSETWPAQLEARLRKAGQKVEVVNGGCGGWSIKSQTLFLQERALALQPHAVVLLFCNNDIDDLRRPKGIYEVQKEQIGTKSSLKKALKATATYELLLRVKVALKRARQKANDEVPHPLSSVDVPKDQLEGLWTQYGEWLDKLLALLKPKKIPLVVLYQPDPWKFTQKLEADDEVRLRKLCGDRDIPFGTALPRFEAKRSEQLFCLPLDSHPNGAGYTLIAESALETLAGAGVVKELE